MTDTVQKEKPLSEKVWVWFMVGAGLLIASPFLSAISTHAEVSKILISNNSAVSFSLLDSMFFSFALMGGLAVILSLLHGHILHGFMTMIFTGAMIQTLNKYGLDQSHSVAMANWLMSKDSLDPIITITVTGWCSVWALGKYFLNCLQLPYLGFRNWKKGFLKNNKFWLAMVAVLAIILLIKKLKK